MAITLVRESNYVSMPMIGALVRLEFDSADGGGFLRYQLSDERLFSWVDLAVALSRLGLVALGFEESEPYYDNEGGISWTVVRASASISQALAA